MDNSSINWENQSASVLNSDWCLKCAELDYCTCIEDPSDAVEAIQEVPYLRVTLATYFVCIGFGAIGNLITLFTMATADRKNKTGTNIFLISLTIADLLLVFVYGPMEVVQYLAREFVNASACKIAEYSRVLSGVASILNLVAVTTERFIVIVFPMKSRSLCTMTNLRRGVFFVWGLSLLLAAPVLYTKSTYSTHYGNNVTLLTVSYCNDFDDYLGYVFTIYQLVVCFAAPALFMIVGYSVVIRVLWKSNKNMSMLTNNMSSGSSSSLKTRVSTRGNFGNSTGGVEKSPMITTAHSVRGGQQQQRAEDVMSARKQVIKMLICIVIVFLLCWGPRFIMELLMKMQFSWLYYQHVYVIRTVLFLLPMVHAILNPMIYFIMSRNFRNSVVKKCANGCCENGPQGSFEDLEMKHNNTHRNGKMSNNHSTATVTIKQNVVIGVPSTTITNGANTEKLVKTNHELVVVRSNGQVTVDLIERSPELT